jgi:chromate reductase, NAD(P)H dehydrogenase (quinone)
MITIISGTNRVGSNTRKVAVQYQELLASKGIEANLLDLEWMQSVSKTEEFLQIEKDILIPTQKFIVISPEYNGAFPGVLKLMIDLCDIRNVWNNKKIALAGVASGRAGNLRGLDNLTNIFNYLKASVYWNKIPLSSIESELTPEGKFAKEATITTVNTQLDGFLNF